MHENTLLLVGLLPVDGVWSVAVVALLALPPIIASWSSMVHCKNQHSWQIHRAKEEKKKRDKSQDKKFKQLTISHVQKSNHKYIHYVHE